MRRIETIVGEIRKAETKKGMPVKVVAVDGHGGSGKSTLAKKLSEELGAMIVQTDDFASYENPLNWWPIVIEKSMEPIKNGAKTVSYIRSSWGPDHHPKPVKDKPVTPILILEGVSSSRKEFRPYLTFSIWVETPLEICLQRGLEREGQDARDKWIQWQADEKSYVDRDNPKAFANLVVDGTVEL